MILEMNARPGLNIQIANGCGIVSRLRRIDEIFDPSADAISRARVAREEFSTESQAALALE